MANATAMRFAVWASKQREAGKLIEVVDVVTHWEISRAQAYRWLADYFDAQGWAWPRPREIAMPKYKSERSEHPWKRDLRIHLAREAA